MQRRLSMRSAPTCLSCGFGAALVSAGEADIHSLGTLPASHPHVRLKAVTLVPGSQEQVGLVRWALERLGLGQTVALGAGSSSRISSIACSLAEFCFACTTPR